MLWVKCSWRFCFVMIASLGGKDSNLDSQSQSLVSCPSPIAQGLRGGYSSAPRSTAKLRRAGGSYLAEGPVSSREANRDGKPSTRLDVLGSDGGGACDAIGLIWQPRSPSHYARVGLYRAR